MEKGFNRVCPKCNINVIKNHKGQQCFDCYQKSRNKSFCITCNNKLLHSTSRYCAKCFSASRVGDKSTSWKGGLAKCSICNDNLSIYKNSNQYDTGICKKCYRGENSRIWKKSITTEDRENSKYRNKHPLHRIWRTSVFNRDNYTCQKCNQYGGSLCSHHIESYNKNKEKRYDIDNGITFCNECHISFHKSFGWFDNNLNQLSEYLGRIWVAAKSDGANWLQLK